MQAFMLGNGNWTLPSVAIFLFGLLLPGHWRLYLLDFKLGQRCPALATLEITDCQEKLLLEVRQLIFSRYSVMTITKKSIAPQVQFRALFSYSLILIGAAAMLFCYPFLWSSNVADLIGAGFPFVAGAIFVVGGLLNLTLQAALMQKPAKPSE